MPEPAGEQVGARAAVEPVVAGAAAQQVVAGAAVEAVRARLPTRMSLPPRVERTSRRPRPGCCRDSPRPAEVPAAAAEDEVEGGGAADVAVVARAERRGRAGARAEARELAEAEAPVHAGEVHAVVAGARHRVHLRDGGAAHGPAGIAAVHLHEPVGGARDPDPVRLLAALGGEDPVRERGADLRRGPERPRPGRARASTSEGEPVQLHGASQEHRRPPEVALSYSPATSECQLGSMGLL